MTALLLIPALTIGVTGLFVLLHDLQKLLVTGDLELPTTVAAATAIGVAACLIALS